MAHKNKYVSNQEFSKVFGKETVELDETESSEQNSSLTDQAIASAAETRQLQEELAKSKRKARTLQKQTVGKPMFQIIFSTLGIFMILNGINNPLALGIYFLALMLSFAGFLRTQKEKDRNLEFKNIRNLRRQLIHKHFDNKNIAIKSPYYHSKAGKVVVEESGITNTYKYKMIVDSETGFETVDVRRVS